ncbi:MAG: hypothetical protein V9E82_16280 [Candidatus Nanopelagicales bacterium]
MDRPRVVVSELLQGVKSGLRDQYIPARREDRERTPPTPWCSPRT